MTGEPRAKIPDRVVAGEVVTIKTLASHRMESGHRLDARGARVPRDIIERFEATFDGERVFAADIGPGISANPFIEFAVRIERAGMLRLVWTDGAGETTELRQDIALSP